MSVDPPTTPEEPDANRDELARRRRIREFLDRSRSGAPAAGEAIRERFSGDEVFERVVATGFATAPFGVTLPITRKHRRCRAGHTPELRPHQEQFA